jgi:hypothetical protein
MRAVRDARLFRAVADLRHLQMRAAEDGLARADQARRAAAARLEEGRAAVREAEQGWTAATAALSLDPALSRAWLHVLGTRRGQERRLEDAEAEAAREADARRTALRAAQARSEAAKEQARRGARTLARRREEARLGAVEDQLAAWRGIA